MTLTGLKRGDIVEVSKGGRLFFALVTRRLISGVEFEPITNCISHRSATSREVVGIYRRAKNSREAAT